MASRDARPPGIPLPQRLVRLRELVRWREWYDSKLPFFLAAMCWAALGAAQPGNAQAGKIAALFVLLCLYAAFGHIVNDYADREADRAAGKKKVLAGWREPAALGAVAVPGLAVAAIGVACFDRNTLVLIVAALLLAAVYSLPPLRLKERGIAGWAAATLAQRTLPLAIVFEAFDGWDGAAAGMTVLGTLIGLRFIIVHQLRDRDNDRRSGVRTAATEAEPTRLVALLRVLFALEVACLCVVVAAMSYREPALGVVAFAYAAYLAVASRRGRTVSANAYFVFNGFYSVIWPVTLALLLAVRNPLFVAVVLVEAALIQHVARDGVRKAMRGLRAGSHPAPAIAARADGAASGVRFNKADPYPAYAQLRALGSVLRVDWPAIGSTWVVPRYREGLAVLKDPRFIRTPDGMMRPGPVRGFGRDLLEQDPPDHTRLRKLVSKAFTARTVERFDPRIEQLADQILSGARSRGGIELISEYASIIPITIVSELLGVPIADMGHFRRFIYSLSVSRVLGRRSGALEAEKLRFTAQLASLFASRRENPRDDLLTALVQAEEDGDRLSPDELIGMVYLLLAAGFLTTTNLIGNGMLVLLRHPDQLDLLRRDPGLAETAVDELLRFESPIELSSTSFASVDLEVGGREIRRGAPIRVLIASANRDEAQFATPDTLDITRRPCPHLSFGQGIHYCLGAPLARIEGRIALNKLIEYGPNLRLSDPAQIKYLSHPMLRGVQQLPLRF